VAKGKKSKSYLPKHIMGVKVPKTLRKGKVGEFLSTPVGQAIVAEALLVAGGGLMAQGKGRKSITRKFLRHPGSRLAGLKHETGDAAHRVPEAGAAFAYALREAARAFTEALHTGPGGEAPAWQPEHDIGRQSPPVPATSAASGGGGAKKKRTEALGESLGDARAH
jgi:hypothetical protein